MTEHVVCLGWLELGVVLIVLACGAWGLWVVAEQVGYEGGISDWGRTRRDG